MSHLIDNTSNINAIAYRGNTPWHGLGQKMLENEPLEQWRIRAGLGWEAVKTPVLFADEAGIQTMDNKAVLYRNDTRAPLGVVGADYQIVQPEHVIEFYRDLTERHGFKMETAGAIKDGRVVWALAKTGNTMRIRGNDVVDGYLLLSTSFDGTAATTARFTTVRVVCNNTLSAAQRGKADVSVSHRSLFDMDATKVKLGVGDSFTKFEAEAAMMAERKVSVKESIEFFLRVYHDMRSSDVVAAQAEKTTDKTIARLAALFRHGPGAELPSAKDTAWGLLNAVTRDVDFSGSARSADTRLSSAWFGRGAAIKEKARAAALALVA